MHERIRRHSPPESRALASEFFYLTVPQLYHPDTKSRLRSNLRVAYPRPILVREATASSDTRLGHVFLPELVIISIPETVSMSSRQRKGKVIPTTKLPKQVSSRQDMPGTDETRGITSSMDTVRVQSRTHGHSTHDTDEVELTLLEEHEQRQAAIGVADGGSTRTGRQKLPMSTKDKRSMGLLCVLCEFLCCYRWSITNSR